MDRIIFNEWLNEPRAIDRNPENRTSHLFLDNCGGHDDTPESEISLASILTEKRFLPKNTTHVCQPLDSFVIKAFKTIWRREWDIEKQRRIENCEWAVGKAA